MRILIADDDCAVRSALRFLFEQEADTQVVAEVEDVTALVSAARTMQPDVLLLDWELPSMGRATLGRLRALWPRAYVVVLSGRLEARQSALAAGADAFISKSDSPERLLKSIAALATRPGPQLAC